MTESFKSLSGRLSSGPMLHKMCKAFTQWQPRVLVFDLTLTKD